HADAERDNRDVLTGLVDACLADRQDEIIHLRHFKALAVEDLVFKKDNRVRIANRSLQEALCVGSRVWHDDLETWDVTVPGSIALRVLSCDAGGCTVRATEDHRRAHLAAGHVERLRGGVDD